MGAFALSDLALVVREDVVNAAAVNVKGGAQVLACHGRALDMPAGEAHPPRAIPAQDVLRFGPLPQGKVFRVAFLVAHFLAGARFLFFQAAVGKLAVFRVRPYVKVDIAIHDIGMALVDQALDHGDLLRNVPAGPRADVRARDAQGIHIREVFAGVVLHDLHGPGSQLAGLLEDAILAAIQQVTDIGDVLNVEHVPAAVAQPAHHHVEVDVGLGMTHMRVVLDGWTAHVHVDFARLHGHKILLFPAKNVEDSQCHKSLPS